jgi:biopolymer transport protein ExbD
MKLGSPIPFKKARIEIVPLIDIMFFLLASFMLVSLSMVQMRGMKINMPSAATGATEQKTDFISVTVDVVGEIYLEKDKVSADQLFETLRKTVAEKPDARIYIRADKNATHGTVITVLDKIKQAGVTKVAFEIRPQTESVTAPAASPSPAPPVTAPRP